MESPSATTSRPVAAKPRGGGGGSGAAVLRCWAAAARRLSLPSGVGLVPLRNFPLVVTAVKKANRRFGRIKRRNRKLCRADRIAGMGLGGVTAGMGFAQRRRHRGPGWVRGEGAVLRGCGTERACAPAERRRGKAKGVTSLGTRRWGRGDMRRAAVAPYPQPWGWTVMAGEANADADTTVGIAAGGARGVVLGF